MRRRESHPYLVSVAQGALTLGSRHAREGLPREVGGILVGWREGSHVIVVQDMLLVPHDGRSHVRYDRDHAPAEQLLQQHLAQADNAQLGYVGEWHSHPAPQPPSSLDVSTIRNIAGRLAEPIALIVLMAHRDGHSIEPVARTARRAALRTHVHHAHISTH